MQSYRDGNDTEPTRDRHLRAQSFSLLAGSSVMPSIELKACLVLQNRASGILLLVALERAQQVAAAQFAITSE